MIFARERYEQADSVLDYQAGLGRTAEMAFDDAMATNPLPLLQDTMKLMEDDRLKLIPKDEAVEYGKTFGVDISDKIPESGIAKDKVDIIAERRYQSLKRQAIIESGPDGLPAGAAMLAGGLAGSFLDPIGLAANFIPIVGAAREAQIMAKVGGSALGRFTGRFAIGAAEGAVGTALTEVAVNPMANYVGEDYSLLDSVMSVGLGGIIGGTLHGAIGGIGDFSDFLKNRNLGEPESKPSGPEVPPDTGGFPAVTVKEADEIITAAYAQLTADRPIDGERLIRIQKSTRAIRTNLARKIDPVSFRSIEEASAKVSELDAKVAQAEMSAEELARPFINLSEELDYIRSKLDDSAIPEADKIALVKRQQDIEAMQASGDFEQKLQLAEKADRELEYLKQERDRIANNPEMKARIALAYKKASDEIDANPRAYLVENAIINKYDDGIYDYVNDIGGLPSIKDINESKSYAFKDDMDSHVKDFVDPNKDMKVNESAMQSANDIYEKAKEYFSSASDDEVSILEKEMVARAEAAGIDPEIIKAEIKAMQDESNELSEIAKALIPCAGGFK